jgi:hypothetical protein
MSRHRARPPAVRAVAIAAGGLVLLAGGGCRSSQEAVGDPGGSPPPATATTGTAARTPVAAARCDPAALAEPIHTLQPGATPHEIVCAPPFAVATMSGDGTDREAALLRYEAGGWTLVGSGRFAADGPAVPAGFSTSVVSQWRALVTPPAVRPPAAPASAPPTTDPYDNPNAPTSIAPNGDLCVAPGDLWLCRPAPTTTTTTTTTTTEPPPPPPLPAPE